MRHILQEALQSQLSLGNWSWLGPVLQFPNLGVGLREASIIAIRVGAVL